MNRRQTLIASFGLLAFASHGDGFAQEKIWRVGALFPTSVGPSQALLTPFIDAARELGYIEGKNLILDVRFANNRYDELPRIAQELVRAKVDLIITVGNAATQAAQQASSVVPIVSATVIDPVASGFADSLARPGRNVTGLLNNVTEISGKHVELLAAVVPRLSRIAVLLNSQNPVTQTSLKAVNDAAHTRAITIDPFDARTPEELEVAFAAIVKARPQALIILSDVLFVSQLRRIAELTLNNKIPSILNIREYARAGGLLSYGQPISYYSLRTASYMDKILKGTKPGDLPIEQPTRVDLVINRATFAKFGLAIPRDLALRADEVIE